MSLNTLVNQLHILLRCGSKVQTVAIDLFKTLQVIICSTVQQCLLLIVILFYFT